MYAVIIEHRDMLLYTCTYLLSTCMKKVASIFFPEKETFLQGESEEIVAVEGDKKLAIVRVVNK